MKSDVANGSGVIGGHQRSVSLGHAFRQVTKKIAWARESTLSGLGAGRNMRCDKDLDFALRVSAPGYFRIQDDFAAECATMESIEGEIR
jgi:predicted DNA-binding ribbon-helix-helix protein